MKVRIMTTLEGLVTKNNHTTYGSNFPNIYLIVNQNMPNADQFANRYVLRRRGGNSMNDPILDKLENKYIEVTGYIHNQYFTIISHKEIP